MRQPDELLESALSHSGQGIVRARLTPAVIGIHKAAAVRQRRSGSSWIGYGDMDRRWASPDRVRAQPNLPQQWHRARLPCNQTDCAICASRRNATEAIG